MRQWLMIVLFIFMGHQVLAEVTDADLSEGKFKVTHLPNDMMQINSPEGWTKIVKNPNIGGSDSNKFYTYPVEYKAKDSIIWNEFVWYPDGTVTEDELKAIGAKPVTM